MELFCPCLDPTTYYLARYRNFTADTSFEYMRVLLAQTICQQISSTFGECHFFIDDVANHTLL